MATFLYEAKDSAGNKVRDKISAADKKAAVAAIRKQGLVPTGIKEVADEGGSGGGGAPDTAPSMEMDSGRSSGGGGKVPLNLLQQFTTQLSILQNAGLPIVRSLKILETQQKSANFKRILAGVSDDVESGLPLSEALAKHPKAFDRLYTNMVKAGEAGGVLDTILERLSDFLEKNAALRRKIKGAMIYPAVVLSVSVIIIVGIMLFVIPTFQEMFTDMGIPLPLPTEILITLSSALMNFWWAIPVLPIGGFMLFKVWVATEKGRYMWDVIKLKLPVLGTIARKGTIARFTRTLGTLIAAGVPILEALAIVKNAVGNEVLTKAIDNVYESIREGDTIADPLSQSALFDDLVVNMIDVGEETGEIDKMLIKIADQFDSEVDVAVEGMTSVIEPLLIVFLGGAVGFIVVSLFMPLLSIIQNIQG